MYGSDQRQDSIKNIRKRAKRELMSLGSQEESARVSIDYIPSLVLLHFVFGVVLSVGDLRDILGLAGGIGSGGGSLLTPYWISMARGANLTSVSSSRSAPASSARASRSRG